MRLLIAYFIRYYGKQNIGAHKQQRHESFFYKINHFHLIIFKLIDFN